jgi:hypothetical protein
MERVELEIREHEGKELTGAEMHRLIRGYWSDLAGVLSCPFPQWFDSVRLIPYISDEERFPGRVIELVPRPAFLMDRNLFPQIDCKKKSILLSSWAWGNKIPYRLLAVSHRPDKEVHHVFPQIDFGNGWINADATFPQYRIGMPQPVTFATELTP